MNGIGSHENRAPLKEEWITPRYITEALGEFDLDPCAPVKPPWPIAKNTFNIFTNGLAQPWCGRVWLNPPYGAKTATWLTRLADHDFGTALIFARVETKMFEECVWKRASALLFLSGRISFHHADGSKGRNGSGAASVLVAYGSHDALTLRSCGLKGQYVEWWPRD